MRRHPPAIATAISICKSRALFYFGKITADVPQIRNPKRAAKLAIHAKFGFIAALALLSSYVPNLAAEENIYEQSFHKAWELVADNTAYTERLERWKDWEHKFDGKLKNKRDLEFALTKALNNFGDKYTYFRNEDETAQSHKAEQSSEAVHLSMSGPLLAHISIRNFTSTRTADELAAALKQSKQATGIILDLRNNHGGYVEQALACFELMVDQGRFVRMKGREDGSPYEEIITVERDRIMREVNGSSFTEGRRQNETANKQMIVLVDENTRSAAEMLAGALRDTDRGVLVGKRTFGKGVVQCSWSLEPSCSIKVTMAKYYLPSGEDINGTGVTPDATMDLCQQVFQKSSTQIQKPESEESLSQLFKTLTQTSAPHRISASTERSQ